MATKIGFCFLMIRRKHVSYRTGFKFTKIQKNVNKRDFAKVPFFKNNFKLGYLQIQLKLYFRVA